MTSEDSISLRVPTQVPHLRLKSVRYNIGEKFNPVKSAYVCSSAPLVFICMFIATLPTASASIMLRS